MQRRDFIKMAALSFGASAVMSHDLKAQDGPEEIVTESFKVDPTLFISGNDAITIVWMTDKKSTGWVEYGIDGQLNEKAVTLVDGLIDANKELHSVTLRNLKPGVKYSYRVVSTQIDTFQPYKVDFGPTTASQVNSFTTLSPAKKEFSFIMLNDLHNRWEIIEHNMNFVKNVDYDFIVFNGDIINDPQDNRSTVAFLQSCSKFAGSIPIVFARGNHEARGSYARDIKKYLLPHSEYYFSFNHGDTAFLVMDGGEDKADDHWAYSGLVDFDAYRSEQQHWLAQEVKKDRIRKPKSRIFISHIPLFARGNANTCTDGVAKWGPMLEDIGIDLCLSGHTHRPDYVEKGEAGNFAPVAIGGAPNLERCTVTVIDVSEKQIDVQIILAGEEMVKKQIKLA